MTYAYSMLLLVQTYFNNYLVTSNFLLRLGVYIHKQLVLTFFFSGIELIRNIFFLKVSALFKKYNITSNIQKFSLFYFYIKNINYN